MSQPYRTSDLSRLTVDELARHLDGRTSRTLAHNTYAERDDDGSIGIRFHATRILTFRADGTFVVSTGGWRTVTTKQRLNALLPAGYRIHSERYAWKMTTPEGVIDFEDGDRFGQPAPALDDAASAYAEQLGAEHGANAAAWWEQDAIGGRAGGDVAETARAVLAGIEDGDPMVLDSLPTADLSGQWAGEMTGPDLVAEVLAELGIDDACDTRMHEWFDSICDGYSDAFSMAAQDAIAGACRKVLEDARQLAS